MMDADCEYRQRLAERFPEAQEEKLGSLRQAETRLSNWIEQSYAQTREQLLRELRIVTAVNTVPFITLGLLCVRQRHSSRQLALVATTLLGASALVCWAYLFRQDWLHTLLFGDYLGWGYAGYVTGVACLFTDISFNKGRLSTQLLGAIGLPSC